MVYVELNRALIPHPEFTVYNILMPLPVVDKDLPLGGGRQPPTHTLFDENVCENERN